MKLIVVRHGQTDWNVNGLLQGSTNIPLNDTGKKQAFDVKEKINDSNIDFCISSPLTRALETAHIITNKEIMIDNRLTERGLGELEGKTHDVYRKFDFYDCDLNSNEYGVESIKTLLERVDEFFKEIKNKYSDKTILIVSHAATIRAFHFVINGYDNNTNFLEFKVPNCSILEYNI